MATTAFKDMKKRDRRQYILSQGGDPADFGL